MHVPIATDRDDTHAGAIDSPASETPETIYERRWALTTLDTAMSRAAREYDRGGRSDLFAALRPFIVGDAGGAYQAVADSLGMTEPAVRIAVHRLRRHFGECLRATLAETVDAPEDVDSELRYLFEVLSRRPASSSLKHS